MELNASLIHQALYATHESSASMPYLSPRSRLPNQRADEAEPLDVLRRRLPTLPAPTPLPYISSLESRQSETSREVLVAELHWRRTLRQVSTVAASSLSGRLLVVLVWLTRLLVLPSSSQQTRAGTGTPGQAGGRVERGGGAEATAVEVIAEAIAAVGGWGCR